MLTRLAPLPIIKASSQLPPFIYMMLDHIFISDQRGYVYYDLFDLVIHADHVNKSGELIIKKLTDHTTFVNTSIGTMNKTDEILDHINSKKRTLIYSDSYTEACALYVYYLIHMYHFLPEDIYHIFGNSRYPSFLTNEIKKFL